MFKDLRHAFRVLGQRPGLHAIVVVTLGLALGASTVLVALYNLVAWRTMPVPQAKDLVYVNTAHTSEWIGPYGLNSWIDFQTYRANSSSLEDLAATHLTRAVALDTGKATREVGLGAVSTNYFDVLRVSAARGRTFEVEDGGIGAPVVVVLSHHLWQNTFGGDPEILGKVVRLAGKSATIVGVAPATLGNTVANDRVDLWQAIRPETGEEEWLTDVTFNRFRLLGRLQTGETRQRVAAELGVLAAGLDEESPRPQGVRKVTVSRATVGLPIDRKNMGPSLRLMAVAIGLLLLVACANVAGLLLGRSMERRREMGIRQALGAGRFRLMRQLLTESFLLALLGGLLGLLVATWARGLLLANFESSFISEVHLDHRVLALGFFLCFVTSLLCGMVPAWSTSRVHLVSALKDGGQATLGERRMNSSAFLVAGQVALCTILLTSTGLLSWSLWNLWQADSGYEQEGLLYTRLDLKQMYPDEGQVERRLGIQFFNQLEEKASSLPGVTSAGLALMMPPVVMDITTPVRLPTSSEDDNRPVLFNFVNSGYFESLGLSLEQGRLFGPQDTTSTPGVVVVNRALAESLWPGEEDVLGRRLVVDSRREWEVEPEYEVVGVVESSSQHDLKRAAEPILYFSIHQRVRLNLVLVLRVAGDPYEVTPGVREILRGMNPDLITFTPYSADDLRWAYLAEQRLQAQTVGVFSVLGLLLAVVGVGGMLHATVSRRLPELGLRLALGAHRKDILRLSLVRGLTPVFFGVALGGMGALGASRWLQSLLYEVDPADPRMLLGTIFILLFASFLGAFLPARRASMVDPLSVLRHE